MADILIKPLQLTIIDTSRAFSVGCLLNVLACRRLASLALVRLFLSDGYLSRLGVSKIWMR